MEEALSIFFFFFFWSESPLSLTLRQLMSLSTWELASKLKTKGHSLHIQEYVWSPFRLVTFFPFLFVKLCPNIVFGLGQEKRKRKKISEKRRKRRDFPRLVERNLCKGNEKKRNLFSYLNLPFSFLPSWEKKPEVKI